MTKRVYEVTPYDDKTRLAPADAPPDSPIPAPGRRPLPDQARLLHRPREPHLRSDLRRHPRRQRRSQPDAVRRERHAERARAGAGVRAARQLLRRRRGQLRRPRVLDGRLRDRRRREAVADQLRLARRHLPERRRRRPAQSVRQPLGAAAGLHLGHGDAGRRSASGATASSSNRNDKTGKVEASVPGLEGRFNPDYPPYDLDILDNTRVDVWLQEFRQFEANGRPAASEHHPARQRPHRRHPRRARARRAR